MSTFLSCKMHVHMQATYPPLILASQSAQRRAILAGLGLEFAVVPANIDEAAIQAADHFTRVKAVAKAKALTVAKAHASHLILAADTYVLCGGKSFEKPVDLADAHRMLTELSGQTCQEITGICLLNTATGAEENEVTAAEFVFRNLSQAEIDRYVQTEPVLQWSAAFSPAYPAGAALIASVNGSLTGFSHGLPVEWVMEKLAKLQTNLS